MATQNTITRSTYRAAGQAIATRVSGDPESDNNGLFYIHSDHTSASSIELLSTGLGSATFMTHGNGHASEGLKVANSTKLPLQAAFSPFGEYRIQPSYPTSDITDRGFTGHKHNDEIGLIYMNARYYMGAVGRFISADTIVPDPNNTQSFNRYSYTYNNPIRYTDPTGHLTEEEIEKYFGFSSKQGMLDVGWNPDLVDILWSEEFTWNGVIEYEVDGYTSLAMLALFQVSGSDPLDDDATFRGGFWSVYGGIEVTADVMFSDEASENTTLAQAESDYWQNSFYVRRPPNYTPDKYVYSITNFQGEAVVGGLTVMGLAATGWGLAVDSALLAGLSAGATFAGGGLSVADWLGLDTLGPTERITIISDTPNSNFPLSWHHDVFFKDFAGKYE